MTNKRFTWRTALRLLFMLLMFIGVYDGIRYKNVYDTILYSIVFIGEAFLLFKEYNKHSKQ